jgi:hypothetical protein
MGRAAPHGKSFPALSLARSLSPHSSALVRYCFPPLVQCLIHAPATLVEGPNDAHLVYDNAELSITLDIQCGINDGIAACTGDTGYDVTPFIFPTQTAQPFVVQGGGPMTVSSPLQVTPSVLPAQTPTSSGFITTSAPSSLTTSTASPSSGVSNDGRSNSIVAIPLVIGFAVMMTAVLL